MLKPETQEPPAAPATPCPACRSRDVYATGKTVSASTYWRCATCGEVWNPGRRNASAPYAYHHR